jgi:hypothetical protein
MKTCPTCGHKIRQKLFCYFSGDGCFSLIWREMTKQENSTNRTVTEKDAIRYLHQKANKHLVNRNWLPAFINGRWVLARHVKRIGPNRLRINGHSYDYKLKRPSKLGKVFGPDLTVTFKMGRNCEIEMKNMSIRAEIIYFLDHEEELKPFFKGHKVVASDDSI